MFKVLLCVDVLFTLPMILAGGREIVEGAVVRNIPDYLRGDACLDAVECLYRGPVDVRAELGLRDDDELEPE